MASTETPRHKVPKAIRALPLGQRIKWARQTAFLSHDRLVETMGRGARSYLIRVEAGRHVPGRDLRDAIADATGVPRDLFADDEEEESDLEAALRSLLRRIVREEVRGAA